MKYKDRKGKDPRARWGGVIHYHGRNIKPYGWSHKKQKVQDNILKDLGK